jgi:hypothetical protein
LFSHRYCLRGWLGLGEILTPLSPDGAGEPPEWHCIALYILPQWWKLEINIVKQIGIGDNGIDASISDNAE